MKILFVLCVLVCLLDCTGFGLSDRVIYLLYGDSIDLFEQETYEEEEHNKVQGVTQGTRTVSDDNVFADIAYGTASGNAENDTPTDMQTWLDAFGQDDTNKEETGDLSSLFESIASGSGKLEANVNKGNTLFEDVERERAQAMEAIHHVYSSR